ncbi:helix-turn-helix transcriptional regulator [Klebsiella aerogenes]|uniref:helix-turn-helix transcriptional regulator n=1 Tax=Klebsiella aerogenes TaxID=548 RepID=UPI001F1BE33F|nr:LuxR family transcriptional regulator [Klebsiella aerogenes]
MFYEKTNAESVKRDIMKRLEKLQMEDIMFSYLVLRKTNPSHIFIASTYPAEWVELYISNKYQFIDPVVLTAFNCITPFNWSDCVSVQELKNLSKVFIQSSRYGIDEGFSFVLHDYENNLAILSFLVCTIDSHKHKTIIIQNKTELLALLTEIHAECLAESHRAGGCKISQDSMLTLRENEVFYWASKGKTNAETGVILGLSPGTIKFHMRNIARKLGVSNSKHAIRLGIELKLIKSP